MINSIGIKNFRSLKDLKIGDNDCIDLKPITVLLGKNSSGKSSFLRTFPLFKQSVTSRTRGALALFGDEVDFGDFTTAVSSDLLQDGKEAFIEFHFMGELSQRLPWSPYANSSSNSSSSPLKTDIVYRIKSIDLLEILYVSDFSMKIGENDYSFTIDSSHHLTSLKVNKIEYISELNSLTVDDSGLIPCFPLFNDRKNVFYTQLYTFFGLDKVDTSTFRFNSLYKFNNKDTLKKAISNENAIQFIFPNEKVRKILVEKINDEKFIMELHNRIQLLKFERVYMQVVNDLITNFSSISYSKPLRANADRYYRSRFLSSNEVNSDGSNLVDFYICLGENRQKELNNWMQENFDFFYTIESSQGHKSIFIHEKIDEERSIQHNITDMGFGFSQILPIATQLWSLQSGNRKIIDGLVNYIYAIEQPELHLHPAMQCKLVNALAKIPKVAAKNEIKISFIVETHSETMVNQLGRLIDRGDLSCKDVSVLIFSKDDPNGFTKIQQSKFNSYGELTEWPIGFFGEDA